MRSAVADDRLSPWVTVGGVSLAGVAGFCNSVGLLGVYHQAITHVTGTATQGAAALAKGEVKAAVVAFSIVVAFGLGSVVAGVLVHHDDESLQAGAGQRYGVALLLEAALLLSAWRLLVAGVLVGEHVAAIAAGLQNALATRVSRAVVRTTHITGLVTDVGLAIGARLSHLQRRDASTPPTSRMGLQALLIGGFVAGAVAGALAYAVVGTDALVAPAVATVLMAVLAWRR